MSASVEDSEKTYANSKTDIWETILTTVGAYQYLDIRPHEGESEARKCFH